MAASLVMLLFIGAAFLLGLGAAIATTAKLPGVVLLICAPFGIGALVLGGLLGFVMKWGAP